MAKTILLADDSITIQKIVNLTFSGEGIDVVAVSNGDAALKKVREIHPDLVLADIFMPGENGYELCEHIKNDPDLALTPVILLVGAYEPFDQNEAARVKADGHLTKPFEIRVLISAVNSLIEANQQTAPETAPAETAPVVLEENLESEIPLEFPVGQPATIEITLESEASSFLASSMAEQIPVEVPVEAAPPILHHAIEEVVLPSAVETGENVEAPPPSVVEEVPQKGSTAEIQADHIIPVHLKEEGPVSFAPADKKADQLAAEEGDLLDIYVLEIPAVSPNGEAHQAIDPGSLVIDIWDLPAAPAATLIPVKEEAAGEVATLKPEVAIEPAVPEVIETPSSEAPVEEEVEAMQIESTPAPMTPPVEETISVAETVVPPAIPPSAAVVPAPVAVDEEALADRIAQKVIEKLSREVIERIAWEVIPDLAELLIKERLDAHMKQALKN